MSADNTPGMTHQLTPENDAKYRRIVKAATPGPWTVERNVNAGGTCHLAVTNRNAGKDWMPCSITPMRFVRPIDEANASLIAIAPTALAEYQQEVDWYVDRYGTRAEIEADDAESEADMAEIMAMSSEQVKAELAAAGYTEADHAASMTTVKICVKYGKALAEVERHKTLLREQQQTFDDARKVLDAADAPIGRRNGSLDSYHQDGKLIPVVPLTLAERISVALEEARREERAAIVAYLERKSERFYDEGRDLETAGSVVLSTAAFAKHKELRRLTSEIESLAHLAPKEPSDG